MFYAQSTGTWLETCILCFTVEMQIEHKIYNLLPVVFVFVIVGFFGVLQ